MNLDLDRCPHCSVARPNLSKQHALESNNHVGNNLRVWFIYQCSRCGGVVTAWARALSGTCEQIFPTVMEVSSDIPNNSKEYLEQAISSIHAPAGAVMLAASSVDSMLKVKGLIDGSLYKRIEEAVGQNMITPAMADWAHEIRLDANDQRHADQDSNLPSGEDAQRVIDFTIAFAEYLFVLPAKVQRGLKVIT